MVVVTGARSDMGDDALFDPGDGAGAWIWLRDIKVASEERQFLRAGDATLPKRARSKWRWVDFTQLAVS